MECHIAHKHQEEYESSPRLTSDILKAELPPEISSLSQKEQRSYLATLHGVPTTQITLHKKNKNSLQPCKYSALVQPKAEPTREDIEYFADCRRAKKEAETRAEAKRRELCKRDNERRAKVLAKYNLRLNGRKRKPDDQVEIEKPDESNNLILRTARNPRRYSTAAWKNVDIFDKASFLFLDRVCNGAAERRLMIAATNQAQDLLTKSPEGYLSSIALRNNPLFREVLKLPQGHILLAGILTCVDRSYEEGRRTQRYALGPFVPRLIELQKRDRITNATYHRSIESFNNATINWAKEKDRKACMIGGFAYACISGRFYNLLTNSKIEDNVERLKAMGVRTDHTWVTRIDLQAALPSLMNQLAKACSLDMYLWRPSVAELKAARVRTAERFNIPLELAKTLHAASHNGSRLSFKSSCWDGYEIDDDTKQAIALCEEILQNRAHFKENFKILEDAGQFNFIEDREGMKKSSQYTLLYNLLESKAMEPLHRYLEGQRLPFVCKHDGADVFARLSERQKLWIQEYISATTPCSIMEKPIHEEATSTTVVAAAAVILKPGSSTPYLVSSFLPKMYNWCPDHVFRSHSPP